MAKWPRKMKVVRSDDSRGARIGEPVLRTLTVTFVWVWQLNYVWGLRLKKMSLMLSLLLCSVSSETGETSMHATQCLDGAFVLYSTWYEYGNTILSDYVLRSTDIHSLGFIMVLLVPDVNRELGARSGLKDSILLCKPKAEFAALGSLYKSLVLSMYL